MPKTRDDFIAIGQRHNTNDVLAEARATLERWTEDLEVLTPWGWGTVRKTRMEELVEQLDARHKLYLTELGDKLSACLTSTRNPVDDN